MTAQEILQATSTASATGLPTRPLGRTGELVSILGIGGWHIRAQQDEAEAIRILHTAQDEGLTFFDNAWDYHDGAAEELMGRALAIDNRRQRVFLMTKNCERDYAGSLRCLEDSLRRLQTDYLDLWQFHEIVYDNDPEWIWERGGLRAAVEAQRAGKVRYIGFTGHKDPLIHRRMFDLPHAWDTSMMPVGPLDAHYRSFERHTIPYCVEQGIGIIGMKGVAGGHPLARFLVETGLTAEECYGYCLALPVATQVVGISTMAHLQQNLAVARNWEAYTPDLVNTIRAKVRDVAGDGRYETFKSTKEHDGPHHRKQHGFALA